MARPLAQGLPLTLVTEPGHRGLESRFSTKRYLDLRGETLTWWRERVSSLTLSTPDRALDHYLNGWCLYQVTACRLMARTSQYQNGGAFGFRDQLQDVAALLYTWPQRAREQLLLAASRQFEEGDVQHWWHPPGRGRCTDPHLGRLAVAALGAVPLLLCHRGLGGTEGAGPLSDIQAPGAQRDGAV